MDIGRAFAYVFEDEEWWKKLLIGGVIGLIPVVGQIYLLGYAVRTTKNVIDGRERPLPDPLEDLGPMALQGLMALFILLIYSLPLIVIGSCIAGTAPAAWDGRGSSDAPPLVSGLAALCFGCMAMPYSVVLGLFLPFVLATYADSGDFNAAFKLGALGRMLWANIGEAFVVLLISAVTGAVASFVGSALCGIGAAFTGFFAALVMAYLSAVLYYNARHAA